MRKILSLAVALTYVLGAGVVHADSKVTSTNPNETFFVQIEKSNSSRYIFSLCGASVPGNCEPIGKAQGYTSKELSKASKRLKHRGYGRVASAVGVGAGVALALGVGVQAGVIPIAVVTLGTVAATGQPVETAFAIAAWLGIHGTWTGLAAGTALHPFRTFREARELQSILDKNSDYKVKSIAEFAGDLAEGLSVIK